MTMALKLHTCLQKTTSATQRQALGRRGAPRRCTSCDIFGYAYDLGAPSACVASASGGWSPRSRAAVPARPLEFRSSSLRSVSVLVLRAVTQCPGDKGVGQTVQSCGWHVSSCGNMRSVQQLHGSFDAREDDWWGQVGATERYQRTLSPAQTHWHSAIHDIPWRECFQAYCSPLHVSYSTSKTKAGKEDSSSGGLADSAVDAVDRLPPAWWPFVVRSCAPHVRHMYAATRTYTGFLRPGASPA